MSTNRREFIDAQAIADIGELERVRFAIKGGEVIMNAPAR